MVHTVRDYIVMIHTVRDYRVMVHTVRDDIELWFIQ